MLNLFNNARPDPGDIDRVKSLFIDTFELSEDTMVSIAELRCQEHGCPPVETVLTTRSTDGALRDWRIEKSIKDIVAKDVELLIAQD